MKRFFSRPLPSPGAGTHQLRAGRPSLRPPQTGRRPGRDRRGQVFRWRHRRHGRTLRRTERTGPGAKRRDLALSDRGEHPPADTPEQIRAIYRDFAEAFGSRRCLELTGYDLTTPEGMDRLQDERTSGRAAPTTSPGDRQAGVAPRIVRGRLAGCAPPRNAGARLVTKRAL